MDRERKVSEDRDAARREIIEQERVDETSSDDALADADQDIGVGPIEGDETIDDDTPYRHTPIPPTPR